MTFNEIEKEFDECWYRDDVKRGLYEGKLDKEYFKSFLKQSFIKYLQADIERWKKVFDYHNDMSNERHSTMRNVARVEIKNLEAQLKELL